MVHLKAVSCYKGSTKVAINGSKTRNIGIIMAVIIYFEAVSKLFSRQLRSRSGDMGAEELKSKYLLKRDDEKHSIWVSNGDHMGIKWWSKMRGVSMTASLHEMIVAFLAPKLQEAHQEVIFHAVKEKVLPEEALDGPLRRLLNVPRGLTRRRDLKKKRKLRAKLPKST